MSSLRNWGEAYGNSPPIAFFSSVEYELRLSAKGEGQGGVLWRKVGGGGMKWT